MMKEESTGRTRGRGVSEPYLSGPKFLHRADASDVDSKAHRIRRVRVFSHAKPRETELKIGSDVDCFFFARGGDARNCERARARTHARAIEGSANDEAKRVLDPHAETRRA